MKKILLFVTILLIGCTVFGQDNAVSKGLSLQLDSICKANNINLCSVYFRTGGEDKDSNRFDSKNTAFRFHDSFLIINDLTYYNLDKLIFFKLDIRSNNPKKNLIELYFQGF